MKIKNKHNLPTLKKKEIVLYLLKYIHQSYLHFYNRFMLNCVDLYKIELSGGVATPIGLAVPSTNYEISILWSVLILL